MSTTLTIRNLDEAVKQKLRLRAAMHGRSMEAEVREILAREMEDTRQIQGDSTPSIDHVRGLWSGQGTTDEMMRNLRGED